MADSVNNVIKPCPFCGSEPIKDAGLISKKYTRHSADSCILTNMAFFIEKWNSRPLEDAARQDQFERDCKVICSLCEESPAQLDSHGDWVHPNAHYQDFPCLASPLREEQHVV